MKAVLFPTAALASGFVVGGIPFSFLVARRYGVDLRAVGSGNIGATNVWRNVGRGAGTFAFFLDFAKGFFPSLAFSLLGGDIAGLAALVGSVLGHSYSLFLRGRGGKGVATGGGAFFALAPVETGIALAVFTLVGPLLSRTISAGSIAAAFLLPILLYARRGPGLLFFAGLSIGLLVILRHRGNIARLWAGTEPKIR